MHIVRFSERHIPILASWLKARDMDVPTYFPQIGYIAYQDNQPIVTAFIRQVEGGFGQLDGLCTNPELPAETRDAAIDYIVSELIAEAKALNLIALVAFSKDKNTLMRSKKYQFIQSEEVILVLNLKQWPPSAYKGTQ